MSREEVHPKSVQAWLAVAMFAPLAHYSEGSWPLLLVLSLAAAGITGLFPNGIRCDHKILNLLEVVWILILSGQYMALSSAYWPGEKSDLVIPGVLLLLAAFAVSGRPDRTGAVLLWLLILLLIPFGLAAGKDGELKWVLPEKLQCSAWVVPVLLLPSAVRWCMAEGKVERINWIIYLPGLCTWCATAVVLSPKFAAEQKLPFRELSRSLTIGAGSRFESLASVAITLGWFALAALFLKLASGCLEKLGVKKKAAPWVAVIPAIVLSWMKVQINPLIAAGITLILWVIAPILHCRKNSKKSEKSA